MTAQQTSNPHAKAVRDHLSAAFEGSEVVVFEWDDVPSGDARPRLYVVMHVERRFGGPTRVLRGRSRTGWRLTTREVGTNVDEVRWIKDRLMAIENVPIEEIGSAGLEFEVDAGPAKDGDRFSGRTDWTYST